MRHTPFDPSAGRACVRSIHQAIAAGRLGWEFVDREMQIQIEAGVATPDDYAAHFEAAGIMDSWNAYLAWTEENPGKPAPPEVNRIPRSFDRVSSSWWQSPERWSEAMQREKPPTTRWQELRAKLAQAMIIDPGFTLRLHGISPGSDERRIEYFLGRLNDPETFRRIKARDEAMLNAILGDVGTPPRGPAAPIEDPEFVRANHEAWKRSRGSSDLGPTPASVLADLAANRERLEKSGQILTEGA